MKIKQNKRKTENANKQTKKQKKKTTTTSQNKETKIEAIAQI